MLPAPTRIDTKSLGVLGGGTLAEGNATLIPFMCVWLRLTIMKLANRKNIISINGMISIRACFLGMGDATRILVRSSCHCERDRHFDLWRALSRRKSPPSKRTEGRLIQNGTANGLGHGCVCDAPTRSIHAKNGNAASSL